MTIHADAVGHLAVTWRMDAVPDPDALSRLDAVSQALVERGQPDGLMPEEGPDELVCVRRVALPPHRMHWESSDAELLARWGQAAGQAVSDAVAAGGPDVVRYRSVGHARRDLVAALLSGDRERLWAWRALRIWPASGSASTGDAQVITAVLTEAVRDEPYAGVGLAAELAGAGLLPRFVTTVPESLLVLLAAEAWRCATRTPWPPARFRTGQMTGPEMHGGNGSGARSAESGWQAVAESAMVRALSATPVAGTARAGDATVALAALAVLDSDPGLAAGPQAGDLVARLAERWSGVGTGLRPPADADGSAPPSVGAERGPGDPGTATEAGTGRDPSNDPIAAQQDPPPAQTSWSGSADAVGGQPGAPADSATTTSSDNGPAATAEHGAVTGAQASAEAAGATSPQATPLGRTHWGGLLFLAPLVAAAGLLDIVVDDPDRFGPRLRPVLHALGLRILHLAAASAEDGETTEALPRPRDPAALAFAGLAPDAEPPDAALSAGALDGVVDDLVALLRQDLDDPSALEASLLARVCRREARIEADPGWIDVVLDLDEVDVDVRRAGLDLNPGYLPWLGCVVRFRYG